MDVPVSSLAGPSGLADDRVEPYEASGYSATAGLGLLADSGGRSILPPHIRNWKPMKKNLRLVVGSVIAALGLHFLTCCWSFDSEKPLAISEMPWPNPLDSEDMVVGKNERVALQYELTDTKRRRSVVWGPLTELGGEAVPIAELSDEAIAVLTSEYNKLNSGNDLAAGDARAFFERTGGSRMPRVIVQRVTRQTGRTAYQIVREVSFLRDEAADYGSDHWPVRGDGKLFGPIHCGGLSTTYTKDSERSSFMGVSSVTTKYQVVYRRSIALGLGVLVPLLLIAGCCFEILRTSPSSTKSEVVAKS